MARRGLVLFFLIAALCSGMFATAQAGGFSQCNGGTPSASAGDCPILEMNGDNPALIDFKLPKPIGTVQLPEKVYLFSGPLCIVEYSVRTTMEGLYAVFSDAFLDPFRAILMIYVCVYAISFMYGLVNPKDFGLRLFKIAVVWMLVSDNCTFYNYLYGGFLSASNDLVRIMSEVNSGAPPASVSDAQKQLYLSLDDMFQNVVGMSGLVGLGTLFLTFLESGSKGFAAGLLGALGFGSMALALLRALVTLGIAMAATAFFLLFTPMFLSFFLFQTTKRLFDNWLSMLISYALQPFIIFAFLVMMKVVIDSATPSGEGVDNMMEDAMQFITNQTKDVNMLDSIKSGNIYIPDPKALQNLGSNLIPPITVNPCADMNAVPPQQGCDNQGDIDQKFAEHFMPKLLFWFLVNMIMAGFIREVPGFAQRLAGYISAPALGATSNSFMNSLGGNNLTLPGITRGLGGGTTSMLGEALRRNKAVRAVATAGAGLATAAALTARRGGPNAANQATDGQTNREGARLTRTGTLAELLGSKTTGRDGTQAGGIGSEQTAPREGTKVSGIGSEQTAVRKETTIDAIRKAQQQELAVANENVRRGAELLGVKAPELPKEKPTVSRNLLLRDIELVTQKEKSSIYMVNGKKVEVNKGEEERFLMQKIAEINKDMTKTKVMGARGGAQLSYSQQQKELLQKRLNEVIAERQKAEAAKLILAEKRALEALQKAPPSPEVARILQQLPTAVRQQNTQAGAAQIGQSINQLKELNNTRYAGAIRELEQLQKAMQIKAAQRGDTMQNAPKIEMPTPPDMGPEMLRAQLHQEAMEALERAGLQEEAQRLSQTRDAVAIDAISDALAAQKKPEYDEAVVALERLERRLEADSNVNAEWGTGTDESIDHARKLAMDALQDANLHEEAAKLAAMNDARLVDDLADALAAQNLAENQAAVDALHLLDREMEAARDTATKQAAAEAERLLAEKASHPDADFGNMLDNLFTKKEVKEEPQLLPGGAPPLMDPNAHKPGFVPVSKTEMVPNEKFNKNDPDNTEPEFVPKVTITWVEK